MSSPFSRRHFLKQAAVAGVGLGLLHRFSPAARAAAPVSANSRLRVAIAGLNGRGIALIQCFASLPNTEIVYLCDVDDRALAKGLAATAKVQTSVPKTSKDFRRALDDQDVDALGIATPDHWHAPMTILALAAGKHVYVEKPCSHNPHEGELVLQAVEKHGRIVQMGNQRRSFPAMQEAIAQIHAGAIGRPYFARGWYVNNRVSIGRGKIAPVPAWLDYDLWQGPAPRRPFNDNIIHYKWHWHWHWGTGEALNNGTHEMDICRWALGVEHPSKVTSSGGRFHYDDDWETPDTQVIGWDYPDGKSMSWEGRSCNSYPIEGRARGSLVYGTAGSALLDGEYYAFYDAKNKLVKEVKPTSTVDSTNTLSSTGLEADKAHFRNFADAIREGAKQTAPIAVANPSVTMLHLGNIAARVGRSLQCDPANGRIQNDPAAAKLWRRDYEPGWEPKV
ncbi:MAG: Gfo/Idh/MocA family oxidoreductase [Lacunisphaera sp.]|nr:Gfo/Idh/MocA family oxidoreductase [Lacunisphaera sp.]